MITENGLHPIVSLVIIAVCSFFIISTGTQYFNQNRVCVDVPLTETHEIFMCAGHEQINIPLPPLRAI